MPTRRPPRRRLRLSSRRPNVTGVLHMGHALGCTIEDIFTRWKRMAAYNAMWLPGTDHAGIATQMVVERQLREEEKKSRHDIGREAFVERVWDWRAQIGRPDHRAAEDAGLLARLGSPEVHHGSAVLGGRDRGVRAPARGRAHLPRAPPHQLVRLVPDGALRSEVDYDEGAQGELYEFAYPLLDGTGEIVIATTRPETMLGDTAVAVHPDDPRHRAKIGKRIRNPLTGYELAVIADPILVDPKFGTGAVKVTPAHDPERLRVGPAQRPGHDLHLRRGRRGDGGG